MSLTNSRDRLFLSALAAAACGSLFTSTTARADVLFYGDQDLCNTGTYPSDPTAGASLLGLAPGVTSFGAAPVGHSFPFAPTPGDYAGMDQIYVGSNQSGGHDGYSGAAERIAGPQVLRFDYSSLVSGGDAISTLTLGLAFDDFQFNPFGQPFTVSVNGQAYAPLTDLANSLAQGGPVTQFITIGLPVSLLNANHSLTIAIDQGGDGGDGWAIDFASVGVETVPGPAPAALLTLAAFAGRRRRR